jgi:hypothetical protein
MQKKHLVLGDVVLIDNEAYVMTSWILSFEITFFCEMLSVWSNFFFLRECAIYLVVGLFPKQNIQTGWAVIMGGPFPASRGPCNIFSELTLH